MATNNVRPDPIPTLNVTASDVAAASTVTTERLNTSIRQAGGFNGAGRTVTASTFISSTDYFVWADCTAGNITLTLPRVSEYTRMVVFVQKIDVTANTLTVTPNGTDTIDTAGSLAVTKTVMLSPRTNSDWHLCMKSA